MMRLARCILALFCGLATFAVSVMEGRVLCLGDNGHIALEAPHKNPGCPPQRGHGASDDETPGDCDDLSTDVQLTHQGGPPPVDLQHARHFLPPWFAEPARLTAVRPPALSRLESAADPPLPGELARLGAIVLLI